MTNLCASSTGDVAVASARIRTPNDFDLWCKNEVREYLPFRSLLCAMGIASHSGAIQIEAMRPIDYAVDHMASIKTSTDLNERWVIRNWLATREPQLISLDSAARMLSPLELREFSDFALGNIAAHGVISPDGRRACYFSFSGVEEPLGIDVDFKLRLLVPYLHLAFCNLLAMDRCLTSASSKLTKCERKILDGLVSGLTNSEIASSCFRSPHTIKHQVASLLRKLGAANRAEAVAKAIQRGLIES